MLDLADLVLFYPRGHAAHAEPGHPERPERVEAIRRGVVEAGWWDEAGCLEPIRLPAETLAGVHQPAYLERLQAACANGLRLDADTYTTPASWQLALQAAGGAAAVAEAIWTGRAKRGFALCRPPGHHATPQYGMGFCLLNNVALAAEHLLHGPLGGAPNAHQVAIIDLDLHHGNGTQEVFWRRRDAVFFSTHQSPLYPGTGQLPEVGIGAGRGYTVNLPLPPGSGDGAFQAALEQVILPLLDRFAPQMLLVSLGFDSHWRDPLGSLQLSAQGLYALVAGLAAWAGRHCAGRLALVLEGGYDLDAAYWCGQAAVAALLERPWRDGLGPCPQPESRAWTDVIAAASRLHGISSSTGGPGRGR